MHSRRAVLTGIAATAAALPAMAQSDVVGQGLRLRTTDYAVDRAAFRTRLVVTASAPQRCDMPGPPQGVQEIEFPSDNLRLTAWIGRPAERRERMPVVIFLHGGFAFDGSDFAMAQPYRAAGFVLATPVLRGECGQAGHFTLFYDEVSDVLAMAEYMRSQSYVDPARLYLAGHSAGGTLTMLAGMATARFRAIASFSGSPDQIAFTAGEPWSDIVPFDRRNPAEFELRSPLAYATSLKSPARLYYGSEEGFFRTNTRNMASIGRRAGLDVEAVEVPGDHFNAVPEEIARSIAFFRSQS
jgi:dipeptidyl aminopeptidase/acylaminoacyl peptidase